MPSDAELLSRYLAAKDQAAFGELVNRYLPLVFASARRRVNDPGLAEDVAQAVFIVLAKKAGILKTHRPIGDWLLTVTKYTAANAVRQRQRRQKHEVAAKRSEEPMPSAGETEDRDAWVAQLDLAMDRLSSADRQAILLRYYQSAEFDVVAAGLGVSEVAARKRVTRAVERLRTMFARRGITVPAAALMAGLPVTLAAAPSPVLAATISSTGTAATLAGPAVLLSKRTIHAMLVTKLKAVAAVALGVTVLAGGGAGVAVVMAQSTQPAVQLLGPVKPAGWFKMELRRPDGKPGLVGYFEPTTGRQITDSLDGEPVQFVDPVAGIAGRYDEIGPLRQYVIGPAVPRP